MKEKLLAAARAALKNSYAPYSHFSVGAALLTSNGEIYKGCNIENASFSPSLCAERTAFSKAISEGKRDFSAIAIVCSERGKPCPPCGVCRQVMREFCNPASFKIILENGDSFIEYTLAELLPHSFGNSEMEI